MFEPRSNSCSILQNYYYRSMYSVIRRQTTYWNYCMMTWLTCTQLYWQLIFVAVWLSICTVYAKCKLLFATLTHLQSNSRSVVVYELATSFYGSLKKNKKTTMARVCFAYRTTESLLSLNSINACLPWKALFCFSFLTLIQTSWDT